MATLIPDPIPPENAVGERTLAAVLRRLPEDWVVYHEPRIGGVRPDFVILAPELGVLVIEVKDWRLGSIDAVDHDSVMLRVSTAVQEKRWPNPLRQLDGCWQAIKQECEGSRWASALVWNGGRYDGQLCFPIGALVVFSAISRADVARSVHRGAWERIFTPENSVLALERRAWEAMDEAGLVSALKPYFRPFELRQPFTAHQLDVLRWVLFPESRMDVILGGERADGGEVMAVLDARQEQHARSLGSGHRILFGVAGSGKTVLLLARARWLAREHPGQTTLLLCYNKVLAAWLQARMADCPSVTVRHFDGWAKDCGVVRRWLERDDAFGTRVLESLRAEGAMARPHDTILIDEAQDFDPTWFQCALAGMKDSENGDLVVVADGSQQVYKRGRVSWKSLGIKAAGRTISTRFDLDKNYRNTPRIAALAHRYGSDFRDDDGISAVRVGPNACRRMNHSLPTFVVAENHAGQVGAALDIVGRWLRGERSGRTVAPLMPGDIGILYPRLVNRFLIEQLIAGLSELAPTRWLSRPQDKDAHHGVNEAAIKVQTIHSAKGLQFKSVIVLWTDVLPRSGEEIDDSRLLYVAITRAESDLVLLGSGNLGFASELQDACHVRHYPFAPIPEAA